MAQYTTFSASVTLPEADLPDVCTALNLNLTFSDPPTQTELDDCKNVISNFFKMKVNEIAYPVLHYKVAVQDNLIKQVLETTMAQIITTAHSTQTITQ